MSKSEYDIVRDALNTAFATIHRDTKSKPIDLAMVVEPNMFDRIARSEPASMREDMANMEIITLIGPVKVTADGRGRPPPTDVTNHLSDAEVVLEAERILDIHGYESETRYRLRWIADSLKWRPGPARDESTQPVCWHCRKLLHKRDALSTSATVGCSMSGTRPTTRYEVFTCTADACLSAARKRVAQWHEAHRFGIEVDQ